MGYSLLIRFPDQSASFVHGFESGQLYTKMGVGEEINDLPVHLANKELIQMMADHYGYNIRFEDIDDTWTSLYGQLIDISDAINK